MEISSLIKNETIFIDLDCVSREDCLLKMIDGMENAGIVSDKSEYLREVLAREEKGSTGVGFSVAIPHGKSNGVAKPGLAFAKLASPTEWNSLDGKPVEIVFLIGVPASNVDNEHIKILSMLSRKLIHEDFRKSLLNAETPSDIITILSAI